MPKKENNKDLETLIEIDYSSVKDVTNAFCINCSGLLKPKRVKHFESPLVYCGKCDVYFRTISPQSVIGTKKDDRCDTSIVMQDDSEAAVDYHCGKCENTKAYLHEQPPGYADEEYLRIYKCTKCGHVERGAGFFGQS